MVKIKLLKAAWPEEEQYVGGVYDAFKMNYDGKIDYATKVSENMLIPVRPENCEVIDEVESATPEAKSTNVTDRILMVEDGSVDMDGLEEYCEDKGIYVLVYRQGANKPEFLS